MGVWDVRVGVGWEVGVGADEVWDCGGGGERVGVGGASGRVGEGALVEELQDLQREQYNQKLSISHTISEISIFQYFIR